MGLEPPSTTAGEGTDVNELLAKFFNKLRDVQRSSGERDGVLKEALEVLEEAMKLDAGGHYSPIYLVLINLSGHLLDLGNKDLINYFLKAHAGLIMSIKKTLKVWLDNLKEVISYLDSLGVSENPLANVFVLSEVLGLIDPLDPEAYVIRGGIYLNYFKVLKDYEEKSGLPLKTQLDRAFKNALELFVKAVSMDVNCYDGYLGLARLYRLANDLDQAILNYESALRIRKDHEVLKELAEVYRLKGDLELADKYLREYEEARKDLNLE